MGGGLGENQIPPNTTGGGEGLFFRGGLVHLPTSPPLPNPTDGRGGGRFGWGCSGPVSGRCAQARKRIGAPGQKADAAVKDADFGDDQWNEWDWGRGPAEGPMAPPPRGGGAYPREGRHHHGVGTWFVFGMNDGGERGRDLRYFLNNIPRV